jgi:rhodanese-related sulfurtransferase
MPQAQHAPNPDSNASATTMTPAKSLPLATLLLLAACGFQKPDYAKTINPAELNALLQTKDILLIDVHTPEQRHIKGTDLFIPYDQVGQYQDKLPQDKNTPIYVYCQGGPMGNVAARALHELGYRDLTNLEGGSAAWRRSGFAFE